MAAKKKSEQKNRTYTLNEEEISMLRIVLRAVEIFPLQKKMTDLYGEKVANEELGKMISFGSKIFEL